MRHGKKFFQIAFGLPKNGLREDAQRPIVHLDMLEESTKAIRRRCDWDERAEDDRRCVARSLVAERDRQRAKIGSVYHDRETGGIIALFRKVR
jgi:hypothetical protein